MIGYFIGEMLALVKWRLPSGSACNIVSVDSCPIGFYQRVGFPYP